MILHIAAHKATERQHELEFKLNYNDVMMSAVASQITSLTIVYSIVY